jgi:hypothetical protein
VQAIKAKSNGQKVDSDGVVWDTVGDDFDRFELPEVIKDRTRDDHLFKYAASLLARELPRHEAEDPDAGSLAALRATAQSRQTLHRQEALAKLDRYEPGRSEGYEKADRGQDGEPATFDSLVAKEAVRIRVREAAQRKVRTEQRRDLGNLEPVRLTEFLATPTNPPNIGSTHYGQPAAASSWLRNSRPARPRWSTTPSVPSPTPSRSSTASIRHRRE